MRHQRAPKHHPLAGTEGRRTAPPPTATHAVEWSDDRSTFVATCATAQGVEGIGDTAAEALRHLRSVMTHLTVA